MHCVNLQLCQCMCNIYILPIVPLALHIYFFIPGTPTADTWPAIQRCSTALNSDKHLLVCLSLNLTLAQFHHKMSQMEAYFNCLKRTVS